MSNWLKDYEQCAHNLTAGETYLWKNRYRCHLIKKSTFSSAVYFMDADTFLDVDNFELVLSSTKVKDFVCKYFNCDYCTTTPQRRGKHDVQAHGELSREEIRLKKRRG